MLKFIIAGFVGIPVGGLALSSLYHYWLNGTCIVSPDLTAIKTLYKKIKRSWYNNKKSKYLTEIVQDPESGEIYYFGDGLRRNVGTSP